MKFWVIEGESCGMAVASGVEAMHACVLLAGLASVLVLEDRLFM